MDSNCLWLLKPFYIIVIIIWITFLINESIHSCKPLHCFILQWLSKLWDLLCELCVCLQIYMLKFNNLSPVIHFWMNSYSWLALFILGIDICWFISKHSDFSNIYLAMIGIVFVTTWNTISSWMIPCIDVGLTLFFDNASPMRRLNMCWMIANLEHVAVIYLRWLHPRKSFTLAIYGLMSSKNVMRLLINAHLVNTFILKSTPILLHYTPSFPLDRSPNGGLNSCIVSLPQPGSMVTSS